MGIKGVKEGKMGLTRKGVNGQQSGDPAELLALTVHPAIRAGAVHRAPFAEDQT